MTCLGGWWRRKPAHRARWTGQTSCWGRPASCRWRRGSSTPGSTLNRSGRIGLSCYKNLYRKRVEGLYCKRPIQCLASSEILTLHPLTARQVCVYPPPLVRGGNTLAGWRGGGVSIVRKTPDTALYYIYVSTLWGNVSTTLCSIDLSARVLNREIFKFLKGFAMLHAIFNIGDNEHSTSMHR